MEHICVNVSMNGDRMDMEKVKKITEKFGKYCDKAEADVYEVGAAISLLQDWYFDAYGAVPISKTIRAVVKSPSMLEAKEVF